MFARHSQGDTSIFSPANIPGPAGGHSNGNVHINSKQGVLGATWIINSTSVLGARVGVGYTEGGKNPSTLGQLTADFTIPNLPNDSSLAGGLLTVNLSNLSQLGRQSSNPPWSAVISHLPPTRFKAS
jgi:hypothetical protein